MSQPARRRAEPADGSSAAARLWGRLIDPALWVPSRHDVLGRVYQVAMFARLSLGFHAVFVDLFLVLPRATNPGVVWGVAAGVLVWTVVISLVMMRPSRRRPGAFVADALVTFSLVAVTALAVEPGGAELSLAGYWLVGAPLYAAIFWSTWGGVASAAIVSSALFVVPAHANVQRAGITFTVLLVAFCVGILITQIRATITERDAERSKMAALAERERLSRIVHDGALQVLALVEREGPTLGPRGSRLASLARECESQLRIHLQDRDVTGVDVDESVDLASTLAMYSTAKVTVSTMAGEVLVPRSIVEEIEGTLQEILLNVEKHAGPDTEVWVLLDQEVDDEVILWVRDNGAGMAADQARRAAEQGRFGIRDSIIGRISAIGGSAILKSAPGAGTEWELRIPTDVE
ncbi:sensor histidine kinase [Tessaracoccus oleiagri]|uniref:Signal transduction histidine kinase n=1 Tax=Tessaracoccus oleiagri TaxID=686624 RepID=A0A1G9KZK1_9ACTN|nr:ATP-binding protein [Tessaracoccus oleiagri]SDL55290.1 Signal transduction histidine kinase [Tessaracoccus oleiagri]